MSCNNRVYFYTRQWYNTKHIPTLHSSCNFIALNVRVKGDIIDFISFSRWRCATRCWILVSTKYKLFLMWPLSNIYLNFFSINVDFALQSISFSVLHLQLLFRLYCDIMRYIIKPKKIIFAMIQRLTP